MEAILNFMEAILIFFDAILCFVEAILCLTNYLVNPDLCKVELGCDNKYDPLMYSILNYNKVW